MATLVRYYGSRVAAVGATVSIRVARRPYGSGRKPAPRRCSHRTLQQEPNHDLDHPSPASSRSPPRLRSPFRLRLPRPHPPQTKLKMVLNWKYQGPQGWFFLADDRGYFKAAGLDVTMDQGNGSGAPIPLVANGTYDVGFGDINALIEFAAKKPEEAPIAVYVMYNRPPFTIAVRADSPIKTPKDLEGKTLGGAAGDGALKLFPAFCKIAKIDCTQDQDHQHAAEPARADADAEAGRRCVRLRQHHPLFRQADAASIRTRTSASSTTATTAWTSIPTPSSSRRSWSRTIRRR